MSADDAIVFASAGVSLAKRAHIRDGKIIATEDPPWPRILSFVTGEVADPEDLLEILSTAAAEVPAPCVVRGHPLCDVGRRALYDDAKLGPAGLRVVPRRWVGYDIEKVPADGIDPLLEPFRAVARVRRCLHPNHHDVTLVWQITASAGKRSDELRLRLWFLLDRPVLGRQLATWCKPGIEAGWLDPVTLTNEVIPHFISVDVRGGPDPCLQRWGLIRGERHRVPIPADVLRVPGRQHDGLDRGIADNISALKAKLGPRFEQCRFEAIRRIRIEVEAVSAAGAGARHPTYMRSGLTSAAPTHARRGRPPLQDGRSRSRCRRAFLRWRHSPTTCCPRHSHRG